MKKIFILVLLKSINIAAIDNLSELPFELFTNTLITYPYYQDAIKACWNISKANKKHRAIIKNNLNYISDWIAIKYDKNPIFIKKIFKYLPAMNNWLDLYKIKDIDCAETKNLFIELAKSKRDDCIIGTLALLFLGIDPNYLNSEKKVLISGTALWYAKKNKNKELAELLIAAGADPKIKPSLSYEIARSHFRSWAPNMPFKIKTICLSEGVTLTAQSDWDGISIINTSFPGYYE